MGVYRTTVTSNENRPLLAGDVLTSEFAALPGVGEGCGGRLVDDVNDVDSGNAAGVLGRFAPDVVEVIGHGQHGVGDRTDRSFRVLLELLENQRGDELRSQLFVLIDNEKVLVAHLAFDRLDNVAGILERHPLECRPDDHFSIIAQQHHRGGDGFPVRICQRFGVPLGIELSNC